jgi:hypothetical protein
MNSISKYLGELQICWGTKEKVDFMGSARNVLLSIRPIVSQSIEA